jgi:hypothetical protein
VPSLRLLAVAVLAGTGAIVALATGPDLPDGPGGTSTVRGGLVAERPTGSGPASTPGPTPSPSASSAGGRFDVAAENREPGTADWAIGAAAGTRPGLAAYAGMMSVPAGTAVPLMVDGDGPIRVRALRIGWYGGTGARQVWEGTVRARPESGPASGWVARGWADTTGWPEGHYLLRLDRPGPQPVSRYVPLTVRSRQVEGRVVVLASPLSRQAENLTAGRTKVAFARPYRAGYGDGGFRQYDAGIVQTAERTGRRLAYLTDLDVATDPSLLDGAAAVVVGGDSRFWTADLRTAFARARDAGTNLAFFGAGTGSRLVRLAADGRSLTVAAPDPSTSVRFTGLRPSCPVPAGPSSPPTPTGSPSSAPPTGWVVSNADWWGYEGAGVKTGDVLPGVVGPRFDRASTTSPGSPAPMQVLSFRKTPCAGGPAAAQSGVYLTRPSGAGVFVTGTDAWACVVAVGCADEPDPRSRRVLIRITRTVVTQFARSRAGERHPARDSAPQYLALR